MKNTKCVFNVLFVGDAGVGKSAFLKTHLNSEFDTKYTPTLLEEFHPLKFNTSEGEIIFNIWDCVSHLGLRDEHIIGADIAFVFNDLTRKLGLCNVPKYVESIKRIKDIPIFHIGTKCDIATRYVNVKGQEFIINAFVDDKVTHNYYISTKKLINFYTPFLVALRLLLDKPDFEFIPYATNTDSIPPISSKEDDQKDNHDDNIKHVKDKIKKLSNSVEMLEFDIEFLNLKKKEKRLINLKLELEKSI